MSGTPCNRRRLIVIAVSDYGENDESFKKAIEQQVAVVAGWWTSTELEPDRRFEVETPPQKLLSLRQVRAFLHDSDLAEADDDDALVIYITGHGERGVSGRHYLRLALTEDERLPGTALTTSEVISAALSSRSRHALIMVDSCFSGTLRSELNNLLDDLGKSRRRLNSLAVVTAGDFEDSPNVGSFTELIQRALAKVADEPAGFADPYLSFDQWEGLLQEAHEEQTGSAEPLWVWPTRLTQDPSPCLPNPRYRSDQPLVSPALQELSAPADLFTTYWQDRASGRASNEDTGWYFRGRAEAMRTLSGFLYGGEGTLVVTGAAGSGKSALLARLVTLTDRLFLGNPRYAELAREIAPQDRPAVGAIDAAVLARGKTSLDLLSDLLQTSGAAPPAPGDAPLKVLLDHIEQLADGRPVTVVIDGLDEAQEPGACLSDVVLPLARLRDHRGVGLTRLLLGMRSSPTFGSAAERLQDGGADALLDLLQRALADDREPVPTLLLRTDGPDCEEDIAAYAEALLLAGPSDAYRDPATARATAAAIASATVPSFLDARLAADQLRNTSEIQNLQAQPWQARLASGTVALLREDLRDVAQSGGVSADVLLAALRATAFAFGAGLPWDKVWPAAARALLPDGTEADRETLDAAIRLIRSSRLDGYLARGEEDGRTVYRPVHQRVTEELQSSPRSFALSAPGSALVQVGSRARRRIAEASHQRITQVLAQLVRSGRHETAHPYIRRYLVAHADAGQVLRDEWLPVQLLSQETSLTLRSRLGLPLPADSPSQSYVAAAALIEPYITSSVDPGSRASSINFHVSAFGRTRRLGPGPMPTAVPQSVSWEAATNVLASPPAAVKTLTPLELNDGRTLLAAGTKHRVHIWDVASGHHLVDLDTGMALGMRPIRGRSGRVFLAVAGVRGAAVYDPLSGLQVAGTEDLHPVMDLQVLADGDQRWRILLHTRDQGLQLWLPDLGSRLQALPGSGLQRLVIRDHDGRWLIVHKTRTDFLVSGLDEPYVGPTPGLPPDRLLRLISREGAADLLMAYGTGRDTLLWDPQSGQVSQISGVPWHLHSVPDRDGPAALAGLHDGGLAVIWQQQGADWRPAAAMRVGPVHAVTALPSRHGSWRLATAGEDGIRLWEQPKGSRPTGDQIPARRPRVDRDVRAISLGSLVYGGEHAWALGTTEGVQLLRRADLRPIHQLGGRPPVYDIFPATPERNSDLLAVRTETAIEVWDIASNEITLTVPVDQRARACAVELRPDPPHHLTGGPALCVSTPQEGLRVHKLHPDTTVPECSFDLSSRITSLAPVPSEDRTLVAIGASRWVYVWNLDRDAATARLSTGTPAPVESLCTLNSPDGLLLAAASRDAIHVWHTADWRPVATITALGTKKLSYLTGKDGASLLASGDGHSIRIWDPWTGAPVHTLLTAASVYALAANGTDGTLAFGGPAGFAVVDFSALAP
ncbi:AAA family ATPase [Streptomyces canus]|uniref:AAA family ATPase n=1 Tax=Streptomyces canus TaxID=58343 RepID=UPI0030E0B09F